MRVRGLLLFFFVLIQQQAFPQSEVVLESFTSAVRTTFEGEPIQKLYNTRMKSGQFTMVCDSAWRFLERKELRAFGNIQIETESELIWADTLFYYDVLELSNLRGRVVILQDSTTLFGNAVDYNFATKTAIFLDQIRLEDEDGILTAQTGIYLELQDSAIFRGQVQIADSGQYAEGDSLFINRERGYLELFSNIFVEDSTNNAILTGDYLEADSTGRRLVIGDAYLRRIENDTTYASQADSSGVVSAESDSLLPILTQPDSLIQSPELLPPDSTIITADTSHIFAEVIELINRDSTTTITASDNVTSWSETISSVSDTLRYNSETERFILTGNPRAWYQRIQLKGPFIFVQLDSGQVKELTSHLNAFAVQEDSATGRLHQIRGDTLHAVFEDGNLSTITINPDSELLYHTKNEAGEADGAVEYGSPKTTMYFENGELARVVAGQNQGLFLPEYTDLINRTLKGFDWSPTLRPQKPILIPISRFGNQPRLQWKALPSRYLEFIVQ
ncbi:MAG: OstA-like protein [Bacteroidota bacterium]